MCECVYVYLHSQGVLRGLYVLADIEAGDIALNGGHYLPTVCYRDSDIVIVEDHSIGKVDRTPAQLTKRYLKINYLNYVVTCINKCIQYFNTSSINSIGTLKSYYILVCQSTTKII